MKLKRFCLLPVLAAMALPATACPATVEGPGCTNESCFPARCVVVDQVGTCQGNVGVPPGDDDVGGGEGEGAVVVGGEGEGEGEGEPIVVDNTLHFSRGAFVGGARVVKSESFTLAGALSSTRRR